MKTTTKSNIPIHYYFKLYGKVYFLIVITILLAMQTVLAQTPDSHMECIVQSAPTSSVTIQSSFGCTNLSNSYINKYNDFYNSDLTFWKPNSNTAIKHIKINFIIIQKSDGSGNWSVNGVTSNGTTHEQLLLNAVAQVNALYANVGNPSDNGGYPVCGACNQIKDTKIQFDVMGFHYFQNTSHYGPVDHYYSYLPSDEINVYLPANSLTYSNATLASYNLNTDLNTNINYTYNRLLDNPNDVPGVTWAIGQMFTHEFGHLLGLCHTHLGGGCANTCADIYNAGDYFDDHYGVYNSGASKCPDLGNWQSNPYAATSDQITNNIMGNVFPRFYFSPKQIAAIARNLSLKSIRKYVSDCAYSAAAPVEITANEVWDFNVKWYSDVIVKTGNSLTIKCKVFMPAGSKIIVENGATLILDGGEIYSGCASLWAGIDAQSGALVVTQNGAIIEDAQYAILAENNSTIHLDNSTFNKCFIGVYVPQNNSGNVLNGYITGCTFKCDAVIKPAYSGMTYPSASYVQNGNSNVTNSGIFMMNVTFNINGGINKNQFLGNSGTSSPYYGLNQGIVGVNSTLNIQNCYFKDIKTYRDPGGEAIYVDYATLLQTGFGKIPNSGSTNATFENCDYAIRAERSNLNSSLNFMKNVGTGYLTQGSMNKNLNIGSNTIDCRYNGVYAGSVEASLNYNIYDNKIIVGKGLGGNGYGVVMAGWNVTNPHISISDNFIHLYNAYDGIRISTCSNVSASNNHIYMNNPIANRNGISLAACQNAIISCNNITSTGISTSDNQKAIHLASTTNSSISCNSLDNTKYGIRVDGASAGTFLSGNNLNNHANGLYLGTTAIMSNQINRGNKWNQTCSIIDAINMGNSAVSKFYVNPFSSPLLPNNYLPSILFNQGSGSAFVCSSATYNFCGNNILPITNIDELDREIAIGNAAALEYTQTMNYEERQYLFEKLTNDNALLLSDPDFQAFYTGEIQSNTDDFQNIGDATSMLYNMTTSLQTQIEQNNQTISTNLQQIEINNEFLRDESLTEQQKLSLESNNNILQQANRTLQTFNENAQSTLNNNRVLNAENLRLNNDGIITNTSFEINEQQVNDVYLSTIARDNYTFSAEQIATLLSIASQCPFSGGKAVYAARNLYAIIDRNQEFDDPSICLSEGVVLRQASPTNNSDLPSVYEFVSLTPNPVSEVLDIKFELGKDVQGTLELFNTFGQRVKTMRLTANEKNLFLNTNNMVGGIYSYTVKSETGFTQMGKLVVTH